MEGKLSTKYGYMNLRIYKKNAIAWIEKNSYKGISKKYEVARITNSKETNYRWGVV